MIRLNLLPEVKREYLRTRQIQARVISIAIIVSMAMVGLVVAAALWVYGAQTLQMNMLSSSIDKNMNELRSIKDIDGYVTIQNQLTHIDSLHAQKSIFSRVFSVVSNLNPKAPNNVHISSLDASSVDHSLTFQGETSTYTGLETFRDTLKNAEIVTASGSEKLFIGEDPVHIDTHSIGKSSDGKQVVSFRLIATYNPKIFSRDLSDYTIKVPNKETTQTKEAAPDTFATPTSVGGN